jgi:hypothetical protein
VRGAEYTSKVKPGREREREAREAKLAHMREQIASGTLVIRQMTRAERSKWAKQLARRDELLTSVERVKRDAALRNRRRRSEQRS